jgi:hypothetical protein
MKPTITVQAMHFEKGEVGVAVPRADLDMSSEPQRFTIEWSP